jgi:hypothetical protein
MRNSSLKIALAVITTLGTIAVAAFSIYKKDDGSAPKDTPTVVVKPTMNQSSVNTNSNTAVNRTEDRRPIVKNYITVSPDSDEDEEQ